MDPAAKKNNRVYLPLEKKVEVIREHKKSGKSSRALASQFKCGKTQVDNILKRRREWLEAYALDPTDAMKRKVRKCPNHEINALTFEWYKEVTVPVTGTLIREKALSFAHRLGISTFKASNGWLEGFKKRYEVEVGKNSFNKAVKDELIPDWKIKLPKLCEGYELRDVYMAHEMSLYFKASTDVSVYLQGKNFSGGNSEEQVTVMVCVNALGEKEKLVVIGGAAKIHAVYDLELHVLPVNYYYNNNRAQMTAAIFESWLKQFDRHMALQKRKVLLFVEKTTDHPDLNLQNTKVEFLSSSSAAPACQLMDEEVMQVIKLKFRGLQLRHIVRKMVIEDDRSGPELLKDTSLLDAIYWLYQAWHDINAKNIVRCFFKAGFKVSKSSLDDASSEMADDLETEAEDQLFMDVLGLSVHGFACLDSLLGLCNEKFSGDASAEDSHEDIQGGMGEGSSEVHDDEDECVVEPVPITSHDAIECIKKLKYYFLQSGESSLFDSMMDIEKKVDEDIFNKFKLARQANQSLD